jgi:hypothetical protein
MRGQTQSIAELWEHEKPQLLPLPAAPTPPNLTVDGFYFARMTRQEKAR